jgi:uncharacterized membrane protein YdbT with pleckstrin-like domain
MAYYTRVLQPDEMVRCVAKLHWTIYSQAIFLFIFTLIATGFTLAADAQQQAFGLVVTLILLAFAVLSFLRAWFERVTTEIVVTDLRIIHKSGWIARRTEEMNISKVETVDVHQRIGGRIFGYGTVLVRGIGGSWEPLTRVAAPLALRNAIIAG